MEPHNQEFKTAPVSSLRKPRSALIDTFSRRCPNNMIHLELPRRQWVECRNNWEMSHAGLDRIAELFKPEQVGLCASSSL